MKEHAKKAIKHDVEVLGKSVPVIAIAALFLIGSGTAALLTTFGSVSGEAKVTQAIQVNGVNGQLSQTVGLGTQTAGTYFVSDLNSDSSTSTMRVTSHTNSTVTVDLQTQYAENNNAYGEAEDGVTAQNMVYEAPNASNFDAVVSDSTELENALTNSTSKILVKAGTYTLSGNKDLSLGASNTELVSAEGPLNTTIELDEVTLEAGPGDSVTVEGFTFTGSGQGQHGDGFIFRTTDSSDTYDGSLNVKNNVFDASTTASSQREYRYVWAQEVKTINVEGNFFTGNSDAGVEVNAKPSGSVNYNIEGNTFAALADKGIALRVKDQATGTLTIRNNNFVSNSNAAIQTGWSGAGNYTHATFTAEDNYFNRTGTKVEDNTDTSGVDSSLLSEADNPQTDGTITVPANGEKLVSQVTYLDIALSGLDNYRLKTSIKPVR